MSNRIKILALASWYPSKDKPHLGTFVQRQAEAAAQYVDIAVLHVCASNDLKEKFKIDHQIINSTFTVNAYYNQVKNPIIKFWNYFKAHRVGYRYVLQNFGIPDLIHQNIIWPVGLFALYLKIFGGYKYIITEHWTGYLASDGAYKESGILRKILTKAIARNAKIITTVSQDLKKAMSAHKLNTKFEVIGNVVDINIFCLPGPLLISGKFIFLHVSTGYDHQKNISGILDAVKMLSERTVNFELRVISECDYSEHEKMASVMGILNKHVFFEGAKQAKGVAQAMQKSHCFVLFSNYENLPVVILEAMACGLPIISTDVGGIPEYIAKEFGLLVTPRDINALCNSMEFMLNNRDSFDSIKIRNYAEFNFSFKAIGEKYFELYRHII